MLRLLALLLAAFDLTGQDKYRVDTPSGNPEAFICAPSGDIDSALLDTMTALGFSQQPRFGNDFVGGGELFDLKGGFLTRPIVIVAFKRIRESRGTRVIARLTYEQLATSGYRSQSRPLDEGKAVYAVQFILSRLASAAPCDAMRE